MRLTDGMKEVKAASPEVRSKVTEVKVIPDEAGMRPPQTKMPRHRKRRIMVATFFNSLALFILGLTMSMKGPSFIDLQLISGTDVEGGSAFFTASAFGYMIGSLVAGAIYSRVEHKSLLMMIPLIFAGVTFALTPYCEDFMLMVFMHAIMSHFTAIFETTANTVEVRNWEGNSDSAMQFLSFTYSLGGIVGPLIIEPFLAPKLNGSSSSSPQPPVPNIHDNPDGGAYSVDTDAADRVTSPLVATSAFRNLSSSSSQAVVNTTFTPLVLPQVMNARQHLQVHEPPSRTTGQAPLLLGNTSGGTDSSQLETLAPYGHQSRIHTAYLITGVLSVLASIPFFIIYLRNRRSAKANAKKLEKSGQSLGRETAKQGHRLPPKIKVLLIGLLSMFYFFYTTVDDPFSMYLSIFVVSHLSWSKEQGALVSSIYWGFSTVTKLAMVVLVRHVDTSLVLLVSTAGMTLSTLLLVVCSSLRIHALVWVSTALLALSQSAVFGGGIAWADSHLLRVDGKVTSCIMIFASLGAMVDPMLLGVCMKTISPLAFPYLLLGQSFVTFLLFLVMLAVVRPYVLRRYGPPRASCSMSVTDATLEKRTEGAEEEGTVGDGRVSDDVDGFGDVEGLDLSCEGESIGSTEQQELISNDTEQQLNGGLRADLSAQTPYRNKENHINSSRVEQDLFGVV